MDAQPSEAASSRSARKHLCRRGRRVSGWLSRLSIASALLITSALLTVVCTTFAVQRAAAAVSVTGLHLSGSTAKPITY